MLKIMYSMFVTKNENLFLKYVFANTKVNYFIDLISLRPTWQQTYILVQYLPKKMYLYAFYFFLQISASNSCYPFLFAQG